MYMTVMKYHSDKTRTLETINILDVDFIETDKKRRLIYHVGNEEYYQITNKSDLDELLAPEGFDLLDRSNLVNLRKVRQFDKEYGKVYFEENPSPDSKYAIVARIKQKFVSDLIQKVISNNNDTTQEIKIKKHSLKNILKGRTES